MERAVKIKVERGVPVPAGKARGYRRRYPFDQMKLGDSFFIKADKPEARRTNLLNAAAHYRNWSRKPSDKHFRIRTAAEGNGIRVWRIA